MELSDSLMPDPGIVFLKLGGSLITDKMTPRTSRPVVIDRLAREIKSAMAKNPGLALLLGHGSGSFGHTSGKKHRTRDGVSSQEEWLGFAEVLHDAASLNNLVMNALAKNGVQAAVFPPSSAVISTNRRITSWDLEPIQSSLKKGLVPVIYGDVVFDTEIGGTILSTEDLFFHLAGILKPSRILLAGQDPGVWKDFPKCTQLYDHLQPSDLAQPGQGIGKSQAPDVTGGMEDKVSQMVGLIENLPDLECLIFSGEEPGAVTAAIGGDRIGTLISK